MMENTLRAGEISAHAAYLFAERWKGAESEKSDAESFWREFIIDVCGIDDIRDAGVVFQKPVISSKKGTTNFIDVYWKDVALIEHKSAGKNLDEAEAQARDYMVSLPPASRPPVILISDFRRVRIVEYLINKSYEFALSELHENTSRIEAILQNRQRTASMVEVAADQKASQLMADLYKHLEANRYEGHEASVFMVRILFCLFADDTRMWKKNLFQDFLLDTSQDGKDVGARLQSLFDLLDTPRENRHLVNDEALNDFPYVNGGLFREKLPFVYFNAEMRQSLINASEYDWSSINPTIFGSLFQAIKSKEERRANGEHYTTEAAIDKTLKELILDELNHKLEQAWDSDSKLKLLQAELGQYQILDPACGSGNFLITAYKRLRQLELDIIVRLKQLAGTSSQIGLLDATLELHVRLEQLHGIEYEEWSSQIATVALFLTDHQENLKLEYVVGVAPDRFPLSHTANIHHKNSLQVDWKSICPITDKTLIVGNPPFKGSNRQSPEQRSDTQNLWAGKRGSGSVDYVANWYLLAAQYIRGTQARVVFVSTNSITQGEQPYILWNSLYELGVDIDFAHRTFSWESDAAGKASVHCVIIGFSARPKSRKLHLYEYATPTSEAKLTLASQINAYLLDAEKVLVEPRSKPLLSSTPPMRYGNMPNEFGYLANIYESDIETIKDTDPVAMKYLRPLIGASELLSDEKRYCLWLVNATPDEMQSSSFIRERIEMVRRLRSESARKATVNLAKTPYLFQEVREQTAPYLAVPIVSSENRDYIPMKLVDSTVIPTNRLLTIPNSNLWNFAILQSKAFTLWTRAVSGRLKNDYSLSAEITYNNFPFPDLSQSQRERLSQSATGINEARQAMIGQSLALLYKPSSMPMLLVKAHEVNDKAVLTAYGLKATSTDAELLAELFRRYAEQADSHKLLRI